MSNGVNIERAHRMDGTGEYYFSRRLREIAEIEASTGRQIIKLAMGSPDLPPHPSVVERLSQEALRPDVHKYMSFKGELQLFAGGRDSHTHGNFRRFCR